MDNNEYIFFMIDEIEIALNLLKAGLYVDFDLLYGEEE